MKRNGITFIISVARSNTIANSPQNLSQVSKNRPKQGENAEKRGGGLENPLPVVHDEVTNKIGRRIQNPVKILKVLLLQAGHLDSPGSEGKWQKLGRIR